MLNMRGMIRLIFKELRSPFPQWCPEIEVARIAKMILPGVSSAVSKEGLLFSIRGILINGRVYFNE